MGKAYSQQKNWKEAKSAYKKVIEEFSYAQAWDKKGWFWKVAVAARKDLGKIAHKR